MHYQWGRKDPFTPAITSADWDKGVEVQIYKADGTAIAKGTDGIGSSDEQFKFDNTITTTIKDLIQNPSTHYDKGDGANNVPIANTGDLTNDWWNPTTKTIYDPCPNGYKIPESGTYGTASDWTAFPWVGSGLTSGRTWTNTSSFFPASGERNSISGMFMHMISSGYSWMSTPLNTTQGLHLHLYSTWVETHKVFDRSHSIPVRCIRD